MEVERLVETLRKSRNRLECILATYMRPGMWPVSLIEDVQATEKCPIQLNRCRTVATVAKMLVDQGEEQVAGVLVQMFGSGEPYEVCDE